METKDQNNETFDMNESSNVNTGNSEKTVKAEVSESTDKKEETVKNIVDIINGSIMKYDLEKTRVGLKEVNNKVIEIID